MENYQGKKDQRKLKEQQREERSSTRQGATHNPSTKFNSVFISSLSGCPLPKPRACDASRKQTSKNHRPRNRLGQRARQKQWEQVFGVKAKHLVMKKKAREKKVRSDRIRASTLRSKEPVKDASDTLLHPSWQASKRRKEKESKLTSFQGQRTVFSDSD